MKLTWYGHSVFRIEAGAAKMQIPTKSPADSEMMSPGDTR
jgi:L-ascorbate metabolism protein UlaG (beta-lactamase superfamily)